MKILSVIIPTYNMSEYIEQALNSLITDRIEELDILVINDGSKDCTHVCPCGNYRVVDGRAQASGGCEHCFACVQNCPHNAIYLTDGEANRHARYRNRHVTLQDIINANNQL